MRLLISAAMASALMSLPLRSLNGFRLVNTMPAFGALVKPLIDRPGKAIDDSTPGISLAMADIWRITASVRSSEAASGSWAKPIR